MNFFDAKTRREFSQSDLESRKIVFEATKNAPFYALNMHQGENSKAKHIFNMHIYVLLRQLLASGEFFM